MISITKISRVTGQFNTMHVDVSDVAYRLWSSVKPDYRPDIDKCFPRLTAVQADFLRDGIVPNDWSILLNSEGA